MMTLGPPMTLGKTRILKKVAELKPCINWIFGDGCIHSETRQDDNEEVSRAVLSICLTLKLHDHLREYSCSKWYPRRLLEQLLSDTTNYIESLDRKIA